MNHTNWGANNYGPFGAHLKHVRTGFLDKLTIKLEAYSACTLSVGLAKAPAQRASKTSNSICSCESR